MNSNEIGKFIRQKRQELGMTLEQIGDAVGVGKSTVLKWENGSIKNMKRDKISLLANILCVPSSTFIDSESEYPENAVQLHMVPVVGSIACGKPIEAIQSYEGSIPVPYGRKPDFALICNGDSMAPLINHGEYVFIRRQPDVEDGQTAAVQIDGEATLKRVFHRPDGLFLVANNPAYSPIDATGDRDVQILGLAIGVYKDLP